MAVGVFKLFSNKWLGLMLVRVMANGTPFAFIKSYYPELLSRWPILFPVERGTGGN